MSTIPELTRAIIASGGVDFSAEDYGLGEDLIEAIMDADLTRGEAFKALAQVQFNDCVAEADEDGRLTGYLLPVSNLGGYVRFSMVQGENPDYYEARLDADGILACKRDDWVSGHPEQVPATLQDCILGLTDATKIGLQHPSRQDLLAVAAQMVALGASMLDIQDLRSGGRLMASLDIHKKVWSA